VSLKRMSWSEADLSARRKSLRFLCAHSNEWVRLKAALLYGRPEPAWSGARHKMGQH
jgi:hypothetical protein